MPRDYFSNIKSQDAKKRKILKVEYDLKQYAHIPLGKGGNYSQNHLGQNNLMKVHTPYPRG
jgi:hypothetical protein